MIYLWYNHTNIKYFKPNTKKKQTTNWPHKSRCIMYEDIRVKKKKNVHFKKRLKSHKRSIKLRSTSEIQRATPMYREGEREARGVWSFRRVGAWPIRIIMPVLHTDASRARAHQPAKALFKRVSLIRRRSRFSLQMAFVFALTFSLLSPPLPPSSPSSSSSLSFLCSMPAALRRSLPLRVVSAPATRNSR